MDKKKEIIIEYRKRMKELNNVVLRTRGHFLDSIKKQSMNDLVRLIEDEFEALHILQEINDFSMTCHKCGSELRCMKC